MNGLQLAAWIGLVFCGLALGYLVGLGHVTRVYHTRLRLFEYKADFGMVETYTTTATIDTRNMTLVIHDAGLADVVGRKIASDGLIIGEEEL